MYTKYVANGTVNGKRVSRLKNDATSIYKIEVTIKNLENHEVDSSFSAPKLSILCA